MTEPEQEVHNEQKEVYKSRDGFIRMPVIRGVSEIRHVFMILEKFQGKAFICGGYARYCVAPTANPIPATDVDIYCEDEETFLKLKEEFKDLKVRHENEVSLTYERPETGPCAYHLPIQLIKPLLQGAIVAVGDIETILKNFDFTIIRVGLLSQEEALVDADFEHDEKHRLLRLKNIHCPVSSTLRCMKYSRKGYYLRPFEALKLFINWQNRDDSYRGKLIDFLAKSQDGDGLSQEEVNELEALMRID
jgi:hypothetical protein